MTARPSGPQRAILYDDDCGFCKWALDKILAWDRRRMLRPVAIQSEKGAALLASVPEPERLDSWHLVQPSGEVSSAGAGAAPLAELLPGDVRSPPCFAASRGRPSAPTASLPAIAPDSRSWSAPIRAVS